MGHNSPPPADWDRRDNMERMMAAHEDTAMAMALALIPAGRATDCTSGRWEIGAEIGIGVGYRTVPKGAEGERVPVSGNRERRGRELGWARRRSMPGNRWSTAAPRRTAAGSDWKEGIRQGSG